MCYTIIRKRETTNRIQEREDKDMTTTTKNVNITEFQFGFKVTNNRQFVKGFDNLADAKAFAIELAKAENKNVRITTDYWNETIKVA